MKNKKVIIVAAVVAIIGLMFGTLAFMNINGESSSLKLQAAAAKGFTCKKQAGLGSYSGDVNGDGKISDEDVSLALRIVSNKTNSDTKRAFTSCEKKRADINADGKVTNNEVNIILDRIPLRVTRKKVASAKKITGNLTLYCVAKKGNSKSKKITSVNTNKAFYCYTNNKTGIKLSATKSGLLSKYTNNYTTINGAYWIELKYRTAGTKTITAKIGSKKKTVNVRVVNSTTKKTTKKITTTKKTTKKK